MTTQVRGGLVGIGVFIVVKWGGIILYDVTHYPIQSTMIALILYGTYRALGEINVNA